MSTLLLVTILLPAGRRRWWCWPAPIRARAAPGRPRWSRRCVTLVLAGCCWSATSTPAAEPVRRHEHRLAGRSARRIDIRFSLGLDGLSLWLFGLSALLLFTCVLVSWEAIGDRPALFYSLLLLLGSGMLGVFAARDIILFYVFFEFTLIPLFFLIGIWGREDRRYAAVKFFLYHAGRQRADVPGPAGDRALGLQPLRRRRDDVLDSGADRRAGDSIRSPQPYQLWIFLALFAGFAIKVPLFPLHTWLPLAHAQAPTAGSVILAGILLKIGTYGFAAVQHADAARGHGDVHALDAGAVGGRHHLRSAGGPGANATSSG